MSTTQWFAVVALWMWVVLLGMAHERKQRKARGMVRDALAWMQMGGNPVMVGATLKARAQMEGVEQQVKKLWEAEEREWNELATMNANEVQP